MRKKKKQKSNWSKHNKEVSTMLAEDSKTLLICWSSNRCWAVLQRKRSLKKSRYIIQLPFHFILLNAESNWNFIFFKKKRKIHKSTKSTVVTTAIWCHPPPLLCWNPPLFADTKNRRKTRLAIFEPSRFVVSAIFGTCWMCSNHITSNLGDLNKHHLPWKRGDKTCQNHIKN